MSPNDTSVSDAGVTTRLLTLCATLTDALPNVLSTTARTVAVPLSTEVTNPEPSTVATEGLPDVHEACASTIG